MHVGYVCVLLLVLYISRPSHFLWRRRLELIIFSALFLSLSLSLAPLASDARLNVCAVCVAKNMIFLWQWIPLSVKSISGCELSHCVFIFRARFIANNEKKSCGKNWSSDAHKNRFTQIYHYIARAHTHQLFERIGYFTYHMYIILMKYWYLILESHFCMIIDYINIQAFLHQFQINFHIPIKN